MWEEKSFGVENCFPAAEGGKWVKPPVKLYFAEDF
jgi:hypothetical protein